MDAAGSPGPGERSRRLAVITGASSGIGKVFAERLAERKFDLLIVARGEERLEAVAEELRQAHGVRVETLAADLSRKDALAELERRIAGAEHLRLLVNNAGFGTNGPFAESDIDMEEEEVRLNIIAVQRLTRAALPGMLARGRGGIINVSSVAGFQPGPLNATYSATKAFLTSFTQALYEEVRGTGVRVQALCPGFTRTEFQQRAGWSRSAIPSAAWLSAEQVVDASLRDLRRNVPVCVPGLHYRALVALSTTAPRSFVRRVSGLASRRSIPLPDS